MGCAISGNQVYLDCLKTGGISKVSLGRKDERRVLNNVDNEWTVYVRKKEDFMRQTADLGINGY